jgi:hypothetical protein
MSFYQWFDAEFDLIAAYDYGVYEYDHAYLHCFRTARSMIFIAKI